MVRRVVITTIILVIFCGFCAAQDKKESSRPGFFALYGWYGDILDNIDNVEKTGIKWVRCGGRGGVDSESDKCVLEAAKRGIHCVPVLFDKEAAKKNDMNKWRESVRNVIKRYGSGGTIWKENPSAQSLPITYVEVWNEPNIEFLEPPEGMLRDEMYFNLLKIAYEEVKSINKDIKVVGFNTAGGVIVKESGPPPEARLRRNRRALGGTIRSETTSFQARLVP